ncbi:MAG TPA: hypothetical protein VMR21_01945 [Vicinamibacteria bacterium]|nr:hypothetical protein [Vicinamibacteria bacterium]
MPTVVFTSNDLREHQPELAARLEEEVREGAADEPADAEMECRITERRAERARIAVHIEGRDWVVSFAVTAPPAKGELRLETKRALRERGRRAPYQRGTRR